MGDAIARIGDGFDVDDSITSVAIIVGQRHKITILSIVSVNVEMLMYGRMTQSRSVIEKKNKRLTVVDE
jgi:hypothetical protein